MFTQEQEDNIMDTLSILLGIPVLIVMGLIVGYFAGLGAPMV